VKHREIAFEDAVELALIATGGFQKGSAAYDAALALYTDDALTFVQGRRPKRGRRSPTSMATARVAP
jgi:hypothetical protein